MKIVLVTGGFDPIHSGHISYLNHADHLGDHVVVGLNSDEWLTRKKGRPFMPWRERMIVLDNLHMVGEVIAFDDSDNSAIDAIRKVKEKYPNDEIIFANGGDRTKDNIPEMIFDDVEFVFGVGGENKANSSSWILEEWKSPKTERPWGYYRIIHQHNAEVKVKELTVDPGKSLSMQRHNDRSEFWFVSEGCASVYSIDLKSTDTDWIGNYKEHEYLFISKGQWHQLANETDKPCRIIEIQYGTNCVEEDIERK
jgi:cytidyltransferase-like protein